MAVFAHSAMTLKEEIAIVMMGSTSTKLINALIALSYVLPAVMVKGSAAMNLVHGSTYS